MEWGAKAAPIVIEGHYIYKRSACATLVRARARVMELDSRQLLPPRRHYHASCTLSFLFIQVFIIHFIRVANNMC